LSQNRVVWSAKLQFKSGNNFCDQRSHQRQNTNPFANQHRASGDAKTGPQTTNYKLQTFELPTLGLNARNIKVRRSISLMTDVDTGYVKMRRLADSNAAENKRVSARSLKALVELTGASKDCDRSKDWSKKVLRPSARQTHLLWRKKFGLNVGIGTAALSMLIPRCGSNPRVTIGL
jgi:hypothetical protein